MNDVVELINSRVMVDDVEKGMFILRPARETVDEVYTKSVDQHGVWLTFTDRNDVAQCFKQGTYVTQIIPVHRAGDGDG